MKDFISAVKAIGFRRAFYATYLYRPVSRLLHKFHLHYMPPLPPAYPTKDTGAVRHHCTWCGLRGRSVPITRASAPAPYVVGPFAFKARQELYRYHKYY